VLVRATSCATLSRHADPPQYACTPRFPSDRWSVRDALVTVARYGWRSLEPWVCATRSVLMRWLAMPPHAIGSTGVVRCRPNPAVPRPYRDPTTTTRLGVQEIHTTASRPVRKGRCRPSSREHPSPRRGRHCYRRWAPCSAYCRDRLIASRLPSCTARACTPVWRPDRMARSPENGFQRPPPSSHRRAPRSACSPGQLTFPGPPLGHREATRATHVWLRHHFSAAAARRPNQVSQSSTGTSNCSQVPLDAHPRPHITAGEPPPPPRAPLWGIFVLRDLAVKFEGMVVKIQSS
jgi:hypothetical protein